MEEKKEEQGIIKPKGLQEFLAEDPLLTKKFSYEELTSSTKQGVNDSSTDKAYKAYQKVVSHGRKHK